MSILLKTYTGKLVDILHLRPEDIDIVDIAHALSLSCRFLGHCKEFYSVAQHSIFVSEILFNQGCDKHICLSGLLHDATEAYISDIAAPLKQELYVDREFDLTKLTVLEEQIYKIIAQHFQLRYQFLEEEVEEADLIALATEGRQLVRDWNNPNFDRTPVDRKIVPWSPEKAEKEFLRVFKGMING